MSTPSGSVTFQEIPPGQLIVEANYQNMMYGRTFASMPEDDYTVTIQLSEGIRFLVYEVFTAKAAQRIPIAGAVVEVRQNQDVIARLMSNENGIAGPILLPAGEYIVTYRKTGYVIGSMPLVVETDYETRDVSIGLDRTLRVQVFDPHERPLRGANVSAIVGSETISFITDEEGNAYLNLPSGTHIVRVVPPAGYEEASFEVTIDVDPRSQVTQQVIVVPAVIRIWILNPRNDYVSVPEAAVTLFREGRALATVTSNERSGAVFFYLDHNITPGSYEIESYKPGYKRVRRTVEINNLNQSVEVEIEMPWTLLTVHVRDPWGRPVSGATVRVYHNNRLIREGTTQ